MAYHAAKDLSLHLSSSTVISETGHQLSIMEFVFNI